MGTILKMNRSAKGGARSSLQSDSVLVTRSQPRTHIDWKAIYQHLSGAGQVNYRFQHLFGGPSDEVHANQGGSFSLGSRPSAKNSPSLVRLISSFRRSFKCISFNSLFALFAETYNPTIVPSPELSR
jgi:hypothetical protein